MSAACMGADAVTDAGLRLPQRVNGVEVLIPNVDSTQLKEFLPVPGSPATIDAELRAKVKTKLLWVEFESIEICSAERT
jgi:hypothetical protein